MTFTAPVIFEIPVLPRVEKFLRVALGDEPLLASPDLSRPEGLHRLLSLHVWAMAQSEKVLMYTSFQERGPSSGSKRCQYPRELTGRLAVGITEFHHTRRYHLLSSIEVTVLTELIDWLMQQDFLGHMESARPALMPAIRSWVDRYDFSDDDVTETALKQLIIRQRRQPFQRVTRGSSDENEYRQSA